MKKSWFKVIFSVAVLLVLNNSFADKLHIAARDGNITKVKSFIAQGENINAQNNKPRYTPLHWAVQHGHIAIIRLLINSGADIAIKSKSGKTALSIARSKPYKNIKTYPEIIKFLQETAIKRSPITRAEVVKLLQEAATNRLTPIPPTKAPIKQTQKNQPSATKLTLNKIKPILPTSCNTNFIINYSDIALSEKIGSGGFGNVYKAKWGAQEVAVKKLHMKNWSNENEQRFIQETKIWKELTHPNIITFFGICVPPNPYCMVMRYKPSGSLYKLLKSKITLPWSSRKILAIDIASALSYLHKKSILHHDLKSLNVLISQQEGKLHASLTDFGLAETKREINTTTNVGKAHSFGTLLWMAPELLRGKPSTKASDIYSYGMILWEIASRKRPYHEAHPSVIKALITDGDTPNIPSATPSYFTSLIKKCWALDPIQRPTIEEVLTLLSSYPDAHKTQITSTNQRTARSIKIKIRKIKNLLDKTYPEGDDLDEEDIAYRKNILQLLESFTGLQALNTSQKGKLKQIKNSLLKELESLSSESDDCSDMLSAKLIKTGSKSYESSDIPTAKLIKTKTQHSSKT